VTPFWKPLEGRQAILEYSTAVARTEDKISFRYEILVTTIWNRPLAGFSADKTARAADET